MTERSPKTVLLTGVRGNTGRYVAPLLAERGVAVRGGSSRPDAVRIDGVTPVRFDWQDPSSWPPALDGVDAIYLARPEVEDAPERIAALLDGAGKRVVLLSDNVHGEDVPPERWEARVEHAVTSRAAAWTVLRPTWFDQVMSEPRYLLSAVRDEGTLEIPTAGAAIAWVDARDIAEVAVEALLDDTHDGRRYELTGPDALTVAAVARRLGDAAGHAVHHLDSPLTDAVARFAADGSDPWYVDYIRYVWERVSDGSAARISRDGERVLGRPARSFDAYVDDHATAWRR